MPLPAEIEPFYWVECAAIALADWWSAYLLKREYGPWVGVFCVPFAIIYFLF